MQQPFVRRLIPVICASVVASISSNAPASAYQLWEQDVVSVGNYHAGYAALANDASTSWYNPAGIPRIQNQQLVVGLIPIVPSFKYRGTVNVIESIPPDRFFSGVTAQGGTFNLVPNLHYVAPITECIGFGFDVTVPFGLKTDYGRSTPLEYAATLTSITVVNISPALGFRVTDKASFGVGFDIQRTEAEFDSVGVIVFSPLNTNTDSTNRADGTGYGYHLGALYEFTPNTRVGLSYHSQVVHHLSGTSKFQGPIAESLYGQTIYSKHATTRITLPAYTAFSAYHKHNQSFAVMGTALYTQWSIFKTLTLNGIAGAYTPPGTVFPAPSAEISATIPQYYRNTWNFSLGGDYYYNDCLTFRGAIGYDQTPVRNAYRNVQLPDNDRYVFALGGHYQAFKTVGFDLGWMHLFIRQAKVNPPPQVLGAQTVVTNGKVNGSADVYGLQVVWDM